jgi:hypothetical protein
MAHVPGQTHIDLTQDQASEEGSVQAPEDHHTKEYDMDMTDEDSDDKPAYLNVPCGALGGFLPQVFHNANTMDELYEATNGGINYWSSQHFPDADADQVNDCHCVACAPVECLLLHEVSCGTHCCIICTTEVVDLENDLYCTDCFTRARDGGGFCGHCNAPLEDGKCVSAQYPMDGMM